MTAPPSSVEMFTDGACSGNPGPGGWGVILRFHPGTGTPVEKEMNGGEPATTNNRMELMAAIQGLEALTRPCMVAVYTDSEYVKKGMTEWMPKWQRKKFAEVKNADLWRRLVAAADGHRVSWNWVRGHAGHPENERADELARQGLRKVREQADV